MLVLVIGDLHLKISRFDQAVALLGWLNGQIVSIHPDMVVNLGDSFDNHAVLRAEIQSEFYKHVHHATLACNRYIYVLGNHDQYKPNDSKYHALQTFMHGLDGLEVVDKRFDELNMSFVPYMPDHTKFPLDTNEICFAHQTFVGADYGYYRPDIGVDADKIKSELIISGHLHRKQQFGKVFYPGSVISKGVEDVDQIKGIHTLDTETYEIKFIPSPFPKWVGRKYELSPELSLKDVHEDLQNLSDEDVTVVEISGPRAEIVAYTSSEAWKKLKEIKTIRLDTKFIDSEKRMISIKSNSVEGIFDEYVEKVYNGSVDKMRLKQKAAEFFKKKRAL